MDIRSIIPGVCTAVGVILKVIFDKQMNDEKLNAQLAANTKEMERYMIMATEKRLNKIEEALLSAGEQPEETEEEAPE